jgi:hypothetical protein
MSMDEAKAKAKAAVDLANAVRAALDAVDASQRKWTIAGGVPVGDAPEVEALREALRRFDAVAP